jgi:DNA-binding LacI/PurR family transcriptional regulator
VERRKKQGTFIKKLFTEEGRIKLRNKAANIVHVFIGHNQLGSYIQWNESTINELENILSGHGLGMHFSPMPSSRKDLIEKLDDIANSGSRSVVFFPAQVDYKTLKENVDALTKYPGDIFVFNRGTHPTDFLPCHSLSLDPFGEGAMLGEYLAKKGEKDILFIAPVENKISYWLEKRIEGIQCGLEAATDGKIKAKIIFKPWNESLEKTFKYLNSAKETVMLVCSTDQLAVKFMDRAKEWGISKDSYKIVSFDNDPRYRMHNLTTVAPPVNKIAGALADMIVDPKWTKNKEALMSLKIRSKIIERSSD